MAQMVFTRLQDGGARGAGGICGRCVQRKVGEQALRCWQLSAGWKHQAQFAECNQFSLGPSGRWTETRLERADVASAYRGCASFLQLKVVHSFDMSRARNLSRIPGASSE